MNSNTKIEWTDATLNPVVGCTHGCDYCYARRMAKRFKHRCQDCYDFKPHAHLERLDQITPSQPTKKIFIDSMWDWNCKDNEPGWNLAIIEKMRECPQHTFQILSKRPKGYNRYNFPENAWLGATITRTEEVGRAIQLMETSNKNKKFLSIEPFLERMLKGNWILHFDWVIIGAETGNRENKVVPEREWVEELIGMCNEWDIPVFLKDSITDLFPDIRPRREFPHNEDRGE